MSKKRLPQQRPHWYHTTYAECPVCGRAKIYRERRYGRKPKNPNKRWEYQTAYDYCNVL